MSKAKSSSSFAGIPRRIMESDTYKALSFSARALLLELCYQYRGHNNGDLTLAHSVLKDRGWKSRITIEKARDELLEAGLIVTTRQGQFMNPGGYCSLFAIAWLPVSDIPGKKLTVGPTSKPLRGAHEY